MAFVEPVGSIGAEQVNSMLVEFHVSETSGSYRARTRTVGLTDTDANQYMLFPDP